MSIFLAYVTHKVPMGHEFPQKCSVRSVQPFGQLYRTYIHTYKKYIHERRALLQLNPK